MRLHCLQKLLGFSGYCVAKLTIDLRRGQSCLRRTLLKPAVDERSFFRGHAFVNHLVALAAVHLPRCRTNGTSRNIVLESSTIL